ncbi:MAG: GTPase HflX [Chloroflexi bacterium]|nr:GTPase HflX [Chloroflexota bacterium]
MSRRNGPHQTRPKSERACLVGVGLRGDKSGWTLEDSMAELADLARAANAEVVAQIPQLLARPARTYIGRGKLEELKALVYEEEIDVVIFDDELAPAQQKLLEDELQVKVIDRSSLILDVFAQRARTTEGKLQIELAQSEYLLPRLAGQWSHLERLGGGIGTRGPGETQIETDRRLVRTRISRMKKQLRKVRDQRDAQRQNRARSRVSVISLVGYTNAGKSAIFNRMTSGGVIARNQLFSTLDTTTRQLHLPEMPGGSSAVLTDTVGFIHKLPAAVVAAFRATLEEMDAADLFLHVVDASHRSAVRHAAVVDEVLDDLGLGAIPKILVLNKLDRINDDPDGDLPDRVHELISSSRRYALTSAELGWGIDNLRGLIAEDLNPSTPKDGAPRAARATQAMQA